MPVPLLFRTGCSYFFYMICSVPYRLFSWKNDHSPGTTPGLVPSFLNDSFRSIQFVLKKERSFPKSNTLPVPTFFKSFVLFHTVCSGEKNNHSQLTTPGLLPTFLKSFAPFHTVCFCQQTIIFQEPHPDVSLLFKSFVLIHTVCSCEGTIIHFKSFILFGSLPRNDTQPYFCLPNFQVC